MKLQEQTVKKVRSIRVKVVELHTSKPLAVVGLYNGYLQIWNTIKLVLINETQVSEFPIRALALVEKNNCALVGADDGRIYVYELNNLQRLTYFDAHADFIRKIVVNPTNTEFLTCSDDSTIKLWEIGSVMKCISVFSGHTHFVMDICYYLKDTKQFISCSLDGTIKLWDKETHSCIKTYKGHKSGINTLSFCKDESYFISGSDDLTVKVWEISNGNCISTLSGHTNNIIYVYAMTKLPFIVSCSEDGSYRLWDSNTFENIEIINLNSGRVWQFKEVNNTVVIGTDEELIFKRIKTGISLFALKNKKLFFTFQNFMYSCRVDDIHNIKKIAELDFYPEELKVSESGKLISVGDGKNYFVYSSLGFRKRMTGVGINFNFINNEEFIVINDNHIEYYSKSELVSSIKIQGIERILCVHKYIFAQIGSYINVYTLDGTRIFTFDFNATKIIPVETYFIIEKDHKILLFEINDEIITAYLEQDLEIDNIGIPDSFNLLGEFEVKINSYTNIDNILIFENDNKGYYIILRDKPYLYNFGSINGLISGVEDNKILVLDNKKVSIVDLDMDFINFQIKVLDNQNAEVKEIFRTRAISFYESLDMNDEALEICTNDNHKFEILLKLNRLEEAYKMSSSLLMFDRIGQEFLKSSDLTNATECFYKSNNWKSLLFVDLLCNKKYIKEIAENSILEGENNVAFIALMKDGNYIKAGDLLKETKFYNFFKKTYLE